jgi:hypothetical protein
LPHSSSQHHSAPANYFSQSSCNPSISFPINQDADK